MPHSHHAAAHSRTRADHVQETAEDYVEAIYEIIADAGSCRIVDLATRFGVAHVTAIKTVRRLASEGLVETRPYRPVTLTQAGCDLARTCRERHRLVHRFLRALGVDETTAAIDTEGIEHHISPTTLDRMQAFIDAHGD